MVRNVILVLRPTLIFWLSKPSDLFQPPKSLGGFQIWKSHNLPEHLCFPCNIFLPLPLALCLETRTLLVFSFIQYPKSNKQYLVPYTENLHIFVSSKAQPFAGSRKWIIQWNPEKLYYKTTGKRISLSFMEEKGNTVSQCYRVSLTDLEPHRNSISCSLPTSIIRLLKWWRKKAKDLWLSPLESMTICFPQKQER